jgi:hypothetical protein
MNFTKQRFSRCFAILRDPQSALHWVFQRPTLARSERGDRCPIPGIGRSWQGWLVCRAIFKNQKTSTVGSGHAPRTSMLFADSRRYHASSPQGHQRLRDCIRNSGGNFGCYGDTSRTRLRVHVVWTPQETVVSATISASRLYNQACFR